MPYSCVFMATFTEMESVLSVSKFRCCFFFFPKFHFFSVLIYCNCVFFTLILPLESVCNNVYTPGMFSPDRNIPLSHKKRSQQSVNSMIFRV